MARNDGSPSRRIRTIVPEWRLAGARSDRLALADERNPSVGGPRIADRSGGNDIYVREGRLQTLELAGSVTLLDDALVHAGTRFQPQLTDAQSTSLDDGTMMSRRMEETERSRREILTTYPTLRYRVAFAPVDPARRSAVTLNVDHRSVVTELRQAPSMRTLMDRFGLDEYPVRAVVDDLCAKGLVVDPSEDSEGSIGSTETPSGALAPESPMDSQARGDSQTAQPRRTGLLPGLFGTRRS
jgi:hypothetical protein